jgi:putative peptidoglycan lipid II flippase
VSANEQRTTQGDVWPTWPAPGVPVVVDDWRRQAREVAATSGAKTSLVRSATIIAVAFVLSRMLGLAREIILARMFGTSPEYSAYVSAFRIPDLLFLIIMAGSFGSAFIPVFAGLKASGRDHDAWRLASIVLNLSAIALAAGAAVAFVLADPIVAYVIAPEASPDIQQIAANCMRILLLSPIFLGLGIAAKGILEGQDRFTLPAFAPVVYNVCTILGALLLGPKFGVYGVAVGVVAGAVCHLLIQTPGLVATRMRYSPVVDLRAEGVGQVGRLLAPRILGQAAFQINFIVVTNLAWRTGEQSVSALNYGWQLLMLPHGVLALSISTVVFPTMARLYQAGDLSALRQTFGQALRPLLFLSVPAAIGLYFFRTAIVQTIFQSGAFSGQSTQLVVAPLAWFAAGLVAYAAVEVLTRVFYAMHDTWTPVAAGVVTIGLNIGLGLALIDRFGFPALAFSLSLSTALEGAILFAVLGRRLGGIGRGSVRWLTNVAVAGAFMAAVAWFVAPRVTAATAPGTAPRLVQLAIFVYALIVTGASYLLAAFVLKIPELQIALGQATRRLPARLRRRRAAPEDAWR